MANFARISRAHREGKPKYRGSEIAVAIPETSFFQVRIRMLVAFAVPAQFLTMFTPDKDFRAIYSIFKTPWRNG
jgi:hypothetical protein